MRKMLFVLFLFSATVHAQTLTVDKIMADPKWIGTSPSKVFWSYDNKHVLFSWNPEKAISDSVYSYLVNGAAPVKVKYNDAQFAAAASNGQYNKARTKIVFEYKGDIYLQDVVSASFTRITQTSDRESNAVFIMDDAWVAYQKTNNLFAWNSSTGITRQLVDFQKERPASKKADAQTSFLEQQQLSTSEIIRQRKEKADAAKAYLDKIRNTDTVPVIYTGGKLVEDIKLSPAGNYLTYNLVLPNQSAKSTVVPSYVTESGYTTDIPARTKVGAPLDSSSFYIFNQLTGSAILVKMDMLPGIRDKADFLKDHSLGSKDSAGILRTVLVTGIYWNPAGTVAVIDIRSNDFKDRWLMQLEPATGKLKLLDRQRDEAWIGGPGIGWYGDGNAGWIDDNTFYFQGEGSGYSHLYSFNIATALKKQITEGKYEIQQALLSNDKKYFYIITNEEHPGKQNFYRINTDGSNKQKITSMTGGYDVSISPDGKYIAYRYSYQNKPWELYVQENAPGKTPVQVTSQAMSNEWKAYPWRDTKIFSFNNRDGLPVYARVYEPAPGKKNNAAVIFVHGAGYLQNITYSWSYYFREFMFNNLLADKGYTVLDIDYSASAGYGRNWRTAIYRYMGGKDLNDEVDAAGFLVKEYGIDAGRIGMYGGSYGGFMTLMALFTQPDVFKAGAALRPVTDWAHYNDGYTGAILNRPAEDSISYRRSSPINFAAGLKNHLLICHGMVDVNVHYQDAVRLAQRLIELGKDNWELASYPVEDHGFVEPSSWTDEYKRILKLFDAVLLK
ncbi:MAG: prolyl oligopeptidase family serine peptidase [Ferruginibacter sp.]